MVQEALFEIRDTSGSPLALVVRNNFKPQRTAFFSAPEYSQQLGIIKYDKGGIIKPHYHNEVRREVVYTQEVLVIRKGSVRVDLYDRELRYVQNVVLHQHDVIFLISGGHGFEMLEDCEMLEVKQGPYSGVDNDKTLFQGRRE